MVLLDVLDAGTLAQHLRRRTQSSISTEDAVPDRCRRTYRAHSQTVQMRRARGILATTIAFAAIGSVAACGGDPRSVASFCQRLRREGTALTDVSDPAGLAAHYRELEAYVPLQIKDQWHEVTVLLERVTSFDPKNDAEVQAVLAESLQAKTSIEALAAWADVKCKVTLGKPVTSTTAKRGSGSNAP